MQGERGYTIVEVMIFLAVSMALFLSAMLLINGQQDKVRFAQGMRDLDSKIQDIINDVSTGYYPSLKNIKCTYDTGASAIKLEGGGTNLDVGQNKGCVSLGKVLQFAAGGSREKYNLYTVVGRRIKDSTQYYDGGTYQVQVESLVDAKPVAVVSPVDITETDELRWGLKFSGIVNNAGITENKPGMFGIYSSLEGSQLSATVQSGVNPGDQNVQYRLKSGSQLVQSIDFRQSGLGYVEPGIGASKTEVNTAIGMQAVFNYGFKEPYALCFKSGNGDQSAVLTIGQNGRAISTKLEFKIC